MEQRDILPQLILKKHQHRPITFPDVRGKYKEAVDFLVSKGINGKPDGTFGTHEHIKRVDAAVFVVESAWA